MDEGEYEYETERVTLAKDRRLHLALLLVAVLGAVSVPVFMYAFLANSSNRAALTQVVHDNCVNIEQLKAVQVEAARATVAGDKQFLKAHPSGTVDFPARVVLKDIADKQRVVDKFAPQEC